MFSQELYCFFFVVVPLTVAIIYLTISNMSIDNCKAPFLACLRCPSTRKRGTRGVFYKKFSVKNSLLLLVTFCSSPLTNRPIKPLRTAPTPLKNPTQSHSTSSDPQISFCPSFYAQQLSPLFVTIHKLSPHFLSHSTKNSHSKTSSHCTKRKKSLAISKNA